jgi:hypothetical protein
MHRPLFTAALSITLLATGIATHAFWERVDPAVVIRFGFAPADLRATGAWHRLLTSTFLVTGGVNFWKVQFLIAASCGTYEVRHGLRRVAVGFWFTHLGTLIAGSLAIMPFALAGAGWAERLDSACDVGPSAGCYGCFGLLLGELGRPWRPLLAAGIALMTASNLAMHAHHLDWPGLSGDLGHVIAIALGWSCRRWISPPTEAS